MMGQITAWAIQEACGKKKLPKSPQEIESVARIALGARSRQLFTIRFHEKQSWFMRAKAPITAAVTGNRFGKTTGLLASLLLPTFHCVPWAPREEQEQAYRTFCKVKEKYEPPVHIVLAGPDYSNWLPSVVIQKLKEMLPWDALVKSISRVQGQIIDGIEWWNGSTWKILSYEQDTARYESWRAHAIGWDEPPPQDKFIAASRGAIDYGAPHIMSYTPENMDDPWSYDAVYVPGYRIRSEADLIRSYDEKPRIVIVEGWMTDNPHLDQGDIDIQTAMWTDPDVREARIKGTYRHLAGLVYKSFSREKHVRDLETLL